MTKKKNTKKQTILNEEEWKHAEDTCQKYEKYLKDLKYVDLVSPCYVNKKVLIQISVTDPSIIDNIPKYLGDFEISVSFSSKEKSWSEIEESSSSGEENTSKVYFEWKIY